MGIDYLLGMKKFKTVVLFCILSFAISCSQQKKYVEYNVKQGETMRTIAKDLDMKTKDLLRLNPNIGRKPAVNTVIIIPNKNTTSTNSDTKNTATVVEEVKGEANIEEIDGSPAKDLEEIKKQFIIHEVKPKETIYGLKRFYNVTEESLFALNPELSEGLKIGQFIKIKPIEEGEVAENLRYEDVVEEAISLKVALLLPFKSKKYDTVSYPKIFNKNKSLANIVTDFYLGTELAIDSLRKQGVTIELNVFDTEKNSTRIRSILAENDLNKNDVIIGPLYSEEAEIVANKVSIPVVFPVYSKNQSKFSSSKIIKTSPEKTVFRDELISYIKESFTKGTVIIVADEKSNSNSFKIKEALEAHDSIAKVHIVTPKGGYIVKERFLKILKPNMKNWVVMATNDNVIVADAINSLISLPDSTTAKVFAFDKGIAFDRIDNFKLAKIGFTYVSDRYVDESSMSTQTFNSQYYAKNHTMPSFYATKGFDITYDVLMRLASGNSLKSTFNNGASYRVESKFDFSKKLFQTSENNGLFILQYNEDLTLTRLQ
jgi:LysM repeat protein